MKWHSVDAYHTKEKKWQVIALFRYEPEAVAYTERHNGEGGIRLLTTPRELEEVMLPLLAEEQPS